MPGSWQTYQTEDDSGTTGGYVGAIYAGQHVYFSPALTPCCRNAMLTRFDTSQAFDAASSWGAHDLTKVNGGLALMWSGAFDGRWVYVVTAASSLVTRYDTTKPFDAGSAFEAFDMHGADAGGQFLEGAIWDGRYVYILPTTGGALSSVIARFDPKLPFTSPSSWSSFDVTAVNSGAKGFNTGVFDGRYIYLVPGFDGTGDSGLVVRYDTQASFTSVSSWEKFDATAVSPDAKDFTTGGNFDGRFVYFVPWEEGVSGVVVRYDTLGTFGLASSWQSFDTRTLSSLGAAYGGSVFDGRYLYLIPGSNTVVARFDACSPALMPDGSSGAFF